LPIPNDCIKYLNFLGATNDYISLFGWSALHRACQEGDFNFVTEFCKRFPEEMERKTEKETAFCTPLGTAFSGTQKVIAKWLLEKVPLKLFSERFHFCRKFLLFD